MALAYFGAIVTSVAAILALEKWLRIPAARSFLVLTGIYALLVAWRRPWWAWDWPRMVSWRSHLGEQRAAWVLALFGLVLILLGLFAPILTHG